MNENLRFHPDRSQYVLEKLLGEGLNSKVYRALRTDPYGQSRQRVALKFLKDPSSISFLRREFETLMSIRSNYCARVIAWETQNAEPALALEWVDGVSLLALVRSPSARTTMTIQMRDEIVRQIYLGLIDLKQACVFHGDLQPSNVMIDRRGQVRLIDFASGRSASGFLQTTPAFAAPEVIGFGVLSYEADLFALGKIKQHLLTGFSEVTSTPSITNSLLNVDPQKRFLRSSNENLKAQNQISVLVEKLLKTEQDLTTQIIVTPNSPLYETALGSGILNKNGFLQTVGALILILVSTLTVPVRAEAPSDSAQGFARVSFRSEHWMDVQINGRAIGFAPRDISRLSSGTHRISWKSALGAGELTLNVKAGDVLQLNETTSHSGRFKVH